MGARLCAGERARSSWKGRRVPGTGQNLWAGLEPGKLKHCAVRTGPSLNRGLEVQMRHSQVATRPQRKGGWVLSWPGQAVPGRAPSPWPCPLSLLSAHRVVGLGGCTQAFPDGIYKCPLLPEIDMHVKDVFSPGFRNLNILLVNAT